MNERRRLTVEGAVQGVGFRPFVYRLAAELQVGGWVVNSAQGAVIEAEAPAPVMQSFVDRLQRELPPHAAIERLESRKLPACGALDFEIRHSDAAGAKTALILPDLATCLDCLRELHDPRDRRFRYPFTNCTHCGPRYSIIQSLPYDRASTTMRGFVMCADCRAEYENPLDRRFHAQPVACPRCGPQLALWDRSGRTLETADAALLAAAEAIRQGQIVAVKGLGGFQLLVDARDAEAVTRLRARKNRSEKPLAVMFPALEAVERACAVSEPERELLTSSAAPIVLLRRRDDGMAEPVAPDNPYLGAMLPYTPLHHLLLEALGFPVVATSGNLSGDPICADEQDALSRLGAIADLFLIHDRPIARPVDDSVVFAALGNRVTIRRARGYAPEPIAVPGADAMIATGAQQKNTIAIAHDNHILVSQHIGDMENADAYAAFQQTLADLQAMYDLRPTTVACDLHPDYQTTRCANQTGLTVVPVQHHYAHILACMAEHHLDAPVLGVAWDGTGYGTDGTIWGGEFLRVDAQGFTRAAHLRPFPLPGGDAASREPRRSALGLLYALYGRELPRERLAFSDSELDLLLAALERGINAPLTSSMGRLFDGVAALLGLRQRCSFEGQAAMALEFAALEVDTDECYPFDITPDTIEQGACGRIIELNRMIPPLLNESDIRVASARFHNTLVAAMIAVARQVGEQHVVLTGGCFQNRTLLERAVHGLRSAGFTPWWPQRLPPNDGGIAAGQIAAVVRERNGH